MDETQNPVFPSSGVISLLGSFSIGCVLEGGRVSLAHLIEFAHFVDLYVLEDVIYLDAADKDVFLAAVSSYEDCPFKELPDGKLTDAIFDISRDTLAIYDCAEVNSSFSMDGYDYWLQLSEQERGAVCPSPLDVTYFSRDYLLMASLRMTKCIDVALEELAKTRLTLMPSTRNLLPFLEVFHQAETPAQLLYRKLSASHRELIDDVQALLRPRTVYLPPLLSILLKRCETAADIVPRLRELRSEYADFRKSIAEWFKTLDGASTMK